MTRLFFMLPLAIFLAIAVYLAVGLTKDPRKLPSALLDQKVPSFQLPSLKRTQLGLASADLKGQVAFVNVFASWCVPCRAEHPLWMRLSKTRKTPIYAINWKDKRSDAIEWLDKHGDPYSRIGFDPNNRAGVQLGVYGVPETYVIDKGGHIRYKHVGPIFEETYKEIIEPLLRELQR